MKTDQKVKEKEYSLSIKVTDTQKRKPGLKICHNRQNCQIVRLQKVQVQSDNHWCKTDFRNYENYLEKGMHTQNTEESLQ